MEVQVGGLRGFGRPHLVAAPAVRARLEHRGLPAGLLPLPMEIVAEERSLDGLAELAGRLMPAERDQPDAVCLRRLPLAVKPGPCHHEVGVVRVVFLRMVKDLPRPPRILLIPEARDVEVRDRRGVELPDPGLLAPEVVVVRVGDDVVPVGNGPVEVPGIDVRDRAEREIPGIGVVDLECEVGVLELVRLLEDGVLERIALAQRTVAVIVVVHPLVDRRRLLAHGLEGRMRVQQRQRGGQPVVRHAVHAHLAVVVRHMLYQPVDAVVRVGRLVGGGRVRQIDLRAELEDPLRFEPPPQVLDHEDVAVLRQLLQARRHLFRWLVRHTVRRPAEQDRQRSGLPGRREDDGLEPDAVTHGNHDFGELEEGRGRGLLGLDAGREQQADHDP